MDPVEQFETIVSEHYEQLFRFAMSLARSESDAWDLTQQTFYVWARKGHQLRNVSKVKTWLFTTLRRTFLEIRRRQVRFPQSELNEVASELPVAMPQVADRLDGSAVIAALAKLDQIHRSAVSLFYLEDFSYREIAMLLEIPLGDGKIPLGSRYSAVEGNSISGRFLQLAAGRY